MHVPEGRAAYSVNAVVCVAIVKTHRRHSCTRTWTLEVPPRLHSASVFQDQTHGRTPNF